MVPSVTSDLQVIHHAEAKAVAMAAIEAFKENDAVKYVSAVASRVLRTSNPIETVFATEASNGARQRCVFSDDRNTDRCGPHEGEDVARALGREPVVAHHRRC
jgi:hypothetical protein